MLLHIPDVLTPAQVAQARAVLDRAGRVGGRAIAGHQSAGVKNNAQLPGTGAEARELGALVLGALERNPLFITAALPQRVFPPLFNRYGPGHALGAHVANAIRHVTGAPHRVRTDLSCTLFLAEPDEYEGGGLVRTPLFDRDMAINRLRGDLPAGHASPIQLIAVYHNLIRRRADA